MPGFPTKIARQNLGPHLEDERRQVDPKYDLSAANLELLFHQIAGANLTCPLAMVQFTGGDKSVYYAAAAWDPILHFDDGVGAVNLSDIDWIDSIVIDNDGYYQITFSAQAPDQNGDQQDIEIVGAFASAQEIDDPANRLFTEAQVINSTTVLVAPRDVTGTAQAANKVLLVVW